MNTMHKMHIEINQVLLVCCALPWLFGALVQIFNGAPFNVFEESSFKFYSELRKKTTNFLNF